MNILLINRALPVHGPGGLERHVHDLALGLAAAGERVHLLAAPVDEAERARYAAAGVTVHPMAFAHPARYTLGYLARAGEAIEAVLKSESIDLIHAQEFALGFWRVAGGPGTVPSEARGLSPAPVPLVMTVHGTITSETPLHPDVYRNLGLAERARAWARYGRRWMYAPAWRRALRAARRVLVDSAFTRGELELMDPELSGKIAQIPLGVREPGAEPPGREAARAALGWRGTQLLTTGRLEWPKGHAVALEALAGLRESDWHYTITGTGSEERSLREAIARLGLGGRVTLAGWVEEPVKARMLAGADLFLWPERTHPAFGLAGLEALLAGTPVLATRHGAIPEVVGARGGWLVEACEPGAFREALRPLIGNPETLRGARAGLREDALKRFSFEAMIRATLEEYRKAVA